MPSTVSNCCYGISHTFSMPRTKLRKINPIRPPVDSQRALSTSTLGIIQLPYKRVVHHMPSSFTASSRLWQHAAWERIRRIKVASLLVGGWNLRQHKQGISGMSRVESIYEALLPERRPPVLECGLPRKGRPPQPTRQARVLPGCTSLL